jgi:hypothetical protein
VILLVF